MATITITRTTSGEWPVLTTWADSLLLCLSSLSPCSLAWRRCSNTRPMLSIPAMRSSGPIGNTLFSVVLALRNIMLVMETPTINSRKASRMLHKVVLRYSRHPAGMAGRCSLASPGHGAGRDGDVSITLLMVLVRQSHPGHTKRWFHMQQKNEHSRKRKLLNICMSVPGSWSTRIFQNDFVFMIKRLTNNQQNNSWSEWNCHWLHD